MRLTVIHIFGFDTSSALPRAEKCGVAFQLTNILRDIREDAGRGVRNKEFLELMAFEAARARSYYEESRPLLDLIHPRSRSSLWALITIYSRLLDRLQRTNYDVFARRVRLSSVEKSWIIVRALVG